MSQLLYSAATVWRQMCAWHQAQNQKNESQHVFHHCHTYPTYFSYTLFTFWSQLWQIYTDFINSFTIRFPRKFSTSMLQDFQFPSHLSFCNEKFKISNCANFNGIFADDTPNSSLQIENKNKNITDQGETLYVNTDLNQQQLACKLCRKLQ